MNEQDPRRTAVRTVLRQQFGRAIPVTEAMIDAIIAELNAGSTSEQATDGTKPIANEEK